MFNDVLQVVMQIVELNILLLDFFADRIAPSFDFNDRFVITTDLLPGVVETLLLALALGVIPK